MEIQTLTARGDAVDRIAASLVEEKATESARSISKLGVENVHRYRGEAFTLLAFEQTAAYKDDWVMVSVVVDRIDDRTAEIVVFVGGGRDGPFQIPDLEQRLTRREVGEDAYGESGRLGSVVETIEQVCAELDVEVTGE